MARKFKPGDIVQLKSGGPAMTVSVLNEHHMTRAFDGYRCEWFKGASKEWGNFAEETLQAFVAPKKA